MAFPLHGALLLTDVCGKIGFVCLSTSLHVDLTQPGTAHSEIDGRNGVAPLPDRLGDNTLHIRVIRRAMSAGQVPIMMRHAGQQTYLGGVDERPSLAHGEGKRSAASATVSRSALQGFYRDGWCRFVADGYPLRVPASRIETQSTPACGTISWPWL